MIYDPIIRQQVTILGKYPIQNHTYRFGKKERGIFYFALIRYDSAQPGGFAVGTEKDADINTLRADDGICEINKAFNSAPLIQEVT